MVGQKDIIFTSLGMMIIDENQYPPSWKREAEYDILGGGGPYAIIGARIAAGAGNSSRVSGIIDMGSDFPKSVEEDLRSWDTGMVFRYDENRLTTKGINTYDEHDVRHFTYKNSKKRIEVDDLMETGLENSKCFHLICSIERCEEIIDKLTKTTERPLFIYEPLPDVCLSENYEKLCKLLPKIDVFTPNLNEASEFANLSKLPESPKELNELALKFYKYLNKETAGVVLRCGPLGCFVKSGSTETLFPAYHADQANVIDVTGGGNSFCGAFMVGLYLSDGDWFVGAICGNLVSGCILERLGMPSKARSSGEERWNGKSFAERLDIYINNNSKLFDNFDKSRLGWI